MSLLETDDEYGQRKAAERAHLARGGRVTGNKADAAKESPKKPKPLHKDGGLQSYGARHKAYKPHKKGQARGRLVAHAAESALPPKDDESDTVIAFGTHQHKHGPSHHVKRFDEDENEKAFKKLPPPKFNAPRCAENVDINSRNRETKERMVKQDAAERYPQCRSLVYKPAWCVGASSSARTRPQRPKQPPRHSP